MTLESGPTTDKSQQTQQKPRNIEVRNGLFEQALAQGVPQRCMRAAHITWQSRIHDDAAQVALQSIWDASGSFDSSQGVPWTAYAYQRAQWAIKSLLRAEHRHCQVGLYDSVPEPVDAPCNEVRMRDALLGQRAAEALSSMPASDQDLIIAIDVYTTSTAEHARELGVKRTTLSERRRTTLGKLRAVLSEI